jgi:hypothetical protein
MWSPSDSAMWQKMYSWQMSFLKHLMVDSILFVGVGFSRQKFKPSPSNWIEPGALFYWCDIGQESAYSCKL